MVKEYNKKSQSFSADLLVVIVILLFGALFLVMNQINKVDEADLNQIYKQASEDSRIIVEELKSSQILNEENNVDVDKLMSIDLDQLREDLNIQEDFCIVFEKDDKLVKIDPENNINGIGSSEIIVNGVPCSSS
jgi:hypothetical protein